MFDHLLLVLRQVQLRHHLRVPFYEPPGGETYGQTGPFRMVFDQMHYAVDAAVHRSAVVILAAEVLALGLLLVFCYMQGMLYEFVDALVPGRGYRHHRNAQQALHLVHAHRAAVAFDLIHHVECQHHGDVELKELHGKIEIPLDVAGVHDVDYGAGLLLQDEAPGDQLLGSVGRK